MLTKPRVLLVAAAVKASGPPSGFETLLKN
jgi:hypothetical protein